MQGLGSLLLRLLPSPVTPRRRRDVGVPDEALHEADVDPGIEELSYSPGIQWRLTGAQGCAGVIVTVMAAGSPRRCRAHFWT